MRILVACEYSGRVRDAFATLGHYAVSCDFLPTDAPGLHYQGDMFNIINEGWDGMIAHPPCTNLCVSGMHWNSNPKSERFGGAQTEEALDFVGRILAAKIPRIAMENPVGVISTRIRKPDQIIQPYDFGDDASKRTCLWLKGLPPLRPTKRVAGRQVLYKGKIVERWANQTDSGQNNLAPSPDRWKERSETYTGIAEAMAWQWGQL